MSHLKNKIYMRLFLVCFLMLNALAVFSQENEISESKREFKKIEVDSLYREDQFYFSFTYNTFNQQPSGFAQQKFSIGISGGFLRDMPINKDRTIAVASGVGLALNNYNQNLGITQLGQEYSYAILNDFSKNKFSQFLVEVPLELRWRSSTYESYKFWRIYGGVKFSYLLSDRSVLENNEGRTVITGNGDFNKFLYGAYLSAGYNTINVYVYYGLNPVFKSAEIDGKKIDMKTLSIGLIFYML